MLPAVNINNAPPAGNRNHRAGFTAMILAQKDKRRTCILGPERTIKTVAVMAVHKRQKVLANKFLSGIAVQTQHGIVHISYGAGYGIKYDYRIRFQSLLEPGVPPQ